VSYRVCAEKGCPTLIEQGSRDGRCDTHRREKDKARGTRQARGYDHRHEKKRSHWAPKVATGKVNCWRCNKRISPLEPWDLGHDDTDRTIWRGPEHVACNRATRTPQMR
jgi:hypothetical protein